jgi:hypothetical protein
MTETRVNSRRIASGITLQRRVRALNGPALRAGECGDKEQAASTAAQLRLRTPAPEPGAEGGDEERQQ